MSIGGYEKKTRVDLPTKLKLHLAIKDTQGFYIWKKKNKKNTKRQTKSLTLDCGKDPLCLHTKGHDLSPYTCDLIHLLQLPNWKSRTELRKKLPSSSPS